MKASDVTGWVSEWTCRAASSAPAILLTLMVGVVWYVIGPEVDYSQLWTAWGGSVVDIFNLLLTLLVLRSQRKDSAATHAQLDELLEACPAPGQTRGLEDRPESEVEAERKRHAGG